MTGRELALSFTSYHVRYSLKHISIPFWIKISWSCFNSARIQTFGYWAATFWIEISYKLCIPLKHCFLFYAWSHSLPPVHLGGSSAQLLKPLITATGPRALAVLFIWVCFAMQLGCNFPIHPRLCEVSRVYKVCVNCFVLKYGFIIVQVVFFLFSIKIWVCLTLAALKHPAPTVIANF